MSHTTISGAATALSEHVELIRTRRSVGQKLLDPDAPVPHEIVLDAIESARWAPNHKRTEPWTFYLLDRDRIMRLAEMNAELLERQGSKPENVSAKRAEWGAAPGVMILTCTCPTGANEQRLLEDYAACAIAAQNWMLHLWAAGIASKWSTAATHLHEDFWSLLGADPEGTRVVGIFFYGRPLELPKAFRHRSAADATVDFVSAG